MASQMVHISRIEPHPDNVRHDTGDVAELAASIKAQGILHPLVVCAHPWRPGGYQLIAGHRRLAAAKLARLDYVPVHVRAAPGEPQVLMLVENCQREELTAVEKAEAMGVLLESPGWTPARIARETGMSQASVSRYLSLLELDEASRARVRAGLVPVGDAVAAVVSTRQRTRASRGQQPRGPRPQVTVLPEHFAGSHPLADAARVRCELAGHEARKYGRLRGTKSGLACGECWEHVIREDDRAQAGERARAARQDAPAGAR